MNTATEIPVATSQTQAQTEPVKPTAPQQDHPEASFIEQSVYVADQDIIKNYPLEMSNSEIDFDLHTTVRGKKPEDYYVNFLPLKDIQDGFKEIFIGGSLDPVEKVAGPIVTAGKAVSVAMKYQDQAITPAFKYALTGDLEKAYKPWIDIWRETSASKMGFTITKDIFTLGLAHGVSNEDFMANSPIAAIPWFVSEFVPEQMLEFSTKPLNWIGEYGIQKFGPPIINAAIQSKWNKGATREISGLFRKIFDGEQGLSKSFETLGIKPNSRTSDVVAAYKNAVKYAHPDGGGAPDGSEFRAVQNAYERIMENRGEVLDGLFDRFREHLPKQKPKGAKALLMNERGSADLVPKVGDLVKMGKEIGKVVKISGEIAAVNVAGKILDAPLKSLKPMKKEPPAPKLNKETLDIDEKAKAKLDEGLTESKATIESKVGKPITNEEVIEAAKKAKVLDKAVSREVTLQFEAEMLRTRQHMAAMAEGKDVSEEFLQTILKVKSHQSEMGRQLQSQSIKASGEIYDTKVEMLNELLKLGNSIDDIVAASKGVDFTDQAQLAKFYRKFVKPTIGQQMDEFVYMNILSSPLTHIKNITSNILQAAVVNPADRLASGAVEMVLSGLTGKARQHYISEIPAFYKGLFSAFPESLGEAANVMKGKAKINRPELKHLPTLAKWIDLATLGLGKYVPRALEAGDVLFRGMIEAGEVEALSLRLGHTPNPKELVGINIKAAEKAAEGIFRKPLDPTNATGQGKLLSYIDGVTSWIMKGRQIPGFKWFFRFVETPMNIFKAGIEHSPAGFANLAGAKDKADTIGKAMVGSMVYAGAALIAESDRTIWTAPKGEKEKALFDAAGLLPYSVIIGDHSVSYQNLGPLGYPIAMASALHYFTTEHPDALTDSEMEKVASALGGIMGYFSDQSYTQGMKDMVNAVSGQKSKAVASVPTQLIPLSSLQGWVNNITDELQRKVEKKISIESVVDNIQLKIVGMSKQVPAKVDEDENEIKKQNRVINAISPFKVSKINKEALAEYRDFQMEKQEASQMKKEMSE